MPTCRVRRIHSGHSPSDTAPKHSATHANLSSATTHSIMLVPLLLLATGFTPLPRLTVSNRAAIHSVTMQTGKDLGEPDGLWDKFIFARAAACSFIWTR